MVGHNMKTSLTELAQGFDLLQAGDLTGALAIARRLIHDESTAFDAWLLKGNVELLTLKLDMCQRSISRIKRDPRSFTDARAVLLQASLALNTQEYEECRKHLAYFESEIEAKSDIHQAEAVLIQAALSFRFERLSDGFKLLDRHQELVGHSSQALYLRSMALLSEAKLDQVLRLLADIEPTDVMGGLLAIRAAAHDGAGNHSAAIADRERALRLLPLGHPLRSIHQIEQSWPENLDNPISFNWGKAAAPEGFWLESHQDGESVWIEQRGGTLLRLRILDQGEPLEQRRATELEELKARGAVDLHTTSETNSQTVSGELGDGYFLLHLQDEQTARVLLFVESAHRGLHYLTALVTQIADSIRLRLPATPR